MVRLNRQANRRRLRLDLPRIALRSLLFALLVSLAAAPALASFQLVNNSFTATPLDGAVLVEWQTSSEQGTTGFYVLSSTEEGGEYSRVSDLIDAKGGSSIVASYAFTDTDVTNGNPYYYKLQEVENGNSMEPIGLVSAVPGSPTNTPTATAPVPDTLTPTSTSPGSYPGPAATATHSNPYPGPGTVTPTSTATAVPSPTFTTPTSPPTMVTTSSATSSLTTPEETVLAPPTQPLSATATLIPFPTITLIYPNTPTPESASVLPTPGSSGETGGSDSAGGMQHYTPLVFVLLIWLLLGVWFYFSARQLK
jgi:hypothetical protein